MRNVKFTSFNDYKGTCEELNIDVIDECPSCHTKTRLTEGNYSINDNNEDIMFVLECPNIECSEVFAVKYKMHYDRNRSYLIQEGIFPYVAKVDISEEVKCISPAFYNIYSQATKAKEQGLFEICGVGYRKALEFLVKDYCIANNDKESEEKIKSMNLMNVINEYIDYDEIKDMASRAVWIGNDETHYIRLWDDKDVNDLLELIDLTCSWILLKEKTNKYKKEMDKGKKK
ncbi:DUF4145 domain-containing protein [Clostridium beijerinckii]|uniref:DUF4145 domain-containing protein n=1 Tax=Clostridium beijerinckii TaxID=1520 RepID=A0A7X9SM02_CLOBE|nr:DUF4145 domain-containing protein [Clostridium beijerinckii]NMF04360.1 DUF4145 domain-containing protein [Clostridium beijerinckii]NRT74428.1 hypothetical protein [Clostridium beijerinckii]